MKKVIILVIVLFLVLVSFSCNGVLEVKESEETKIELGRAYYVVTDRDNFNVLFFSGKTSENIVFTLEPTGLENYGVYVLCYFPINSERINIGNRELEVIKVSDLYIVVKLLPLAMEEEQK